MRALRRPSIVVLLAAVFILQACGTTAREKALRATFVTVNGARDGFTTFDAQRQQQIVDKAKTLEEGQAALTAYRLDRERVLALFEGVYRALAVAILAEDDAKSMARLVVIAHDLQLVLDDLKKAAGP